MLTSAPPSRPTRVLVTGFGPFRDVDDNPSGRLALAVDGYRDDTLDVTGRVIPVSYGRGPATAIALARSLEAEAIVGLGVAVGRTAVCVERRAVRFADPTVPDVDGACLDALQPDGPDVRLSTLPIERFAEALGAVISDDAGLYVCNAWLYEVSAALGQQLPVGFVHLPIEGLDLSRLLAALRLFAADKGGDGGQG